MTGWDVNPPKNLKCQELHSKPYHKMIFNTPSATGTRPSRGQVALGPCRATFEKSFICRNFVSFHKVSENVEGRLSEWQAW